MGALTGLPAGDASVDLGRQPSAATGSAATGQPSTATGHAGPTADSRDTVGNYDSRTSNAKAVTRASAKVLRDQGDDIQALGARLGPHAVVSVNPLTGSPDNVARLDGFLTSPRAASAPTVALDYVRAHLAEFGLDSDDLGTLTTPTVRLDLNGISHVSWQQSVGGVPVFGNGLRAHVTRDGKLISVQGAPIADLTDLAAATAAPQLSAGTARAAAADDVSGSVANATSSTTSGAERATMWSNGDSASLVYFLTPGGLRSGWSTYVQPGPKQAFQQVIDAKNGSTLYRHSTIQKDRGDGLAFDQYPGAPRGGNQRTVNIYERNYLSRNATWLNGRYVRAWADVNDDNTVQNKEKTGIPGTKSRAQFLLKRFKLDSVLCSKAYPCTWAPNRAYSWRANKNQDGTQGFILASRFHDYLENAPIGFTAGMGNFEAKGGDALRLNVLDGANTTGDGFPDGNHIDNANMNTPPDGGAPTMQMYLNHVPHTTAQEDPYLPASSSDAADNIYHEYTHGLSNRLVVDSGGNSTLNSLHAGAMGEAWSDYYAMDYLVYKRLMKDTDRGGEVLFDRYLTNNRPITRSESIDCFVKATSRFCQKAIGPRGGYTFGDLGNATGGPEVHADGEIWAQTLWDLRRALGHTVTNAIVTEAMSISPADPSFLDERDAIVLADRAIYNGAHRADIWSVFAGRGMGWFASATDGSDASVIENFQVPPRPGTPRYAVTGTVTDDATGAPIEGAVITIPGHSSSISNYSAVTGPKGHYRIRHVLAGRYPEIVARAPGYDIATEVADVRAGRAQVDFELRRDWAATAGGATLDDFTGPNYGPGCGPADALDLNYGEGWSTNRGDGNPTDTPEPKYLVVKLPQPITVSAFGVDPSNTCGDAGSASTGPYRIEVSSNGDTFTQVAQGTFTPADRGRVNEISPDAPLPGVEYVKFWIDDSQVEQLRQPDEVCSEGAPYAGCQYMDLTELEVYGSASGTPPAARDIQILSFNDYHGHLEANDPPQSPLPSTTPPVGGVEYLASHVKALRAEQPRSTLTVAAGDLIGGSTFLSGLFQDQPSVESMNALGLDVSSVGNHEFDEGLKELKRMVQGGCQPAPKGCFTDANGDDIPYAGTDFPYLGANVVKKSTGANLPWLPGTTVRTIRGIKIGFIGMTLEATDTLVNPAGVSAVDFEDEVGTANAKVAGLKAQGVETIVVLLHEGGYQVSPQTINTCNGISDPIKTIAQNLDPEIDDVITGHTHQPYVCTIDDPDGNPRLVTSAASYGQVLTETHLKVDPATGEVIRNLSTATNNLVTRDVVKDAGETSIVDFWKPLSDALGNTVVGEVTEDITGDSGTCRCEETPMVDLVADAILFGTEAPEDGGAQLALMNTGGVRASLLVAPAAGAPEGPGEVTYREAYNVAPFNNILVTLDMTGQQIQDVLNQQYQPITARGSRPMLSLGVSDGFSYEWTWDGPAPPPNTQPGPGANGHVVPGSMTLNGVAIDVSQTYRVATLNFLADGGDSFTAFTAGTNRLGGPEDLANLVAYLDANTPPGLTAPPSRIIGL